MENMTIEQAAANLEQLLNATPLKKGEYDVLYKSLALLFTTAKSTQEVKENENSN